MLDDCAACRARAREHTVLQERFIDDQIRWPDPYRCAVTFTFNYQGSEHVEAGTNGRIPHEQYTETEYGTRDGIRRVLRILRKHDVKATFLVCGAIAEHYPDTVLAIQEDGHEIAGHGYHHEIATDLSREDERETFVTSLQRLRSLTGAPITGWRCCFESPITPELVMEQGLRWNSNSFIQDMPYLLTDGDRTIVEIPRQPFGDMRTYGFEGFGGDPAVALAIWRSAFDTFYEESEEAPTYCPFSLHPFITGRPGRSEALSQLITHIKGREGVWIATSDEVSQAVLQSAGIVTDLAGQPA